MDHLDYKRGRIQIKHGLSEVVSDYARYRTGCDGPAADYIGYARGRGQSYSSHPARRRGKADDGIFMEEEKADDGAHSVAHIFGLAHTSHHDTLYN